jgi:hypothetical protein
MRILSYLTATALAVGTLAVPTLITATPAAAAITFLCTETDAGGCVIQLPITGSTIIVASDGESAFDPFGAGYDTSDGISLDSIWVPVSTPTWVQLPGTNTWVIPACDVSDCEDANIPEGIGQWAAPGFTLTIPTVYFGIYESDGSLSDLITLYNDDTGTVNISFNSSVVPEPASWTMMLVGFGAMGTMVRRRTRKYATA